MELQHPFAVITSAVDGDVLTALAGGDSAFTTGQLNRLAPRRSIQGIRLALTRLVAQGVVDTEVVGRTVRYSLNRDHLAAPAILMLAGQRSELLRRIGSELSKWSDPPVYAAVFGSAGRSDMRTDSDIDLFVVRPNGADIAEWERSVAELARSITRWTGNDARPLVMTIDEIDRGADSERVLTDIVRDGVTVHGSRSWLRRRLTVTD